MAHWYYFLGWYQVLGHQGLGLRITDGVAWVDACPYDGKFQHSMIQTYGQRSASVPTQMIITPIWANMGAYGADDTEKVDNLRIQGYIRKSVRNFLASQIRDKCITFDDVPVIDPAAPSATAAPVLQTNKFVKTCPNSAGFLPLRQDILTLVEQKVQSNNQKSSLQKIIRDHDKACNPSGVLFKGEAKRPPPH